MLLTALALLLLLTALALLLLLLLRLPAAALLTLPPATVAPLLCRCQGPGGGARVPTHVTAAPPHLCHTHTSHHHSAPHVWRGGAAAFRFVTPPPS
jgi:hypothetical protein